MVWGVFRKFVFVWFCDTVARNAVLLDMAWIINNHGGVYKKGAVFPLQKRYQIATSYLQTSSCGAAAAENMCTVLRCWAEDHWQFYDNWPFWPGGKRFTSDENAAVESGLSGSTCYIRPIYVSQWNSESPSRQPKLTCSWNSIYPYNLQNSYQFRVNETQGSKGTFGKVYTSEHSSMTSVCAIAKNCWPKKALFCWWDYYSTR